jgi:hypothetical protein
MTYFFRTYVYDKADWQEHGSMHSGLFSAFNLAIEALKDDIMMEQRFSPDNFRVNREDLPPTPDPPAMIVDGYSHYCKFMYYETFYLGFYVECFKVVDY